MKKLITLIGLILLLSPIYAQIDDQDPQLFGSTRGDKFYAIKSFTDIKDNQISYTFNLKNDDAYDMTIISAEIPSATSVFFPATKILSSEEGKFTVTVYKEFLNSDANGMFLKKVGINISEETLNGVKITKTYYFQMTGSFKK